MKGKLYGIGTGPGDSKLLTIKAKEILDNAKVIAYPVRKEGEEGTALEIVKGAVDISGKEIVELLFKMDPNDDVRRKCRADSIDRLCAILDEGKDVAMITLGDVSVYSTYMYLDRTVRSRGYETEIVPGIPSFCSGAALASVPLMIGTESLAVTSAAKKNYGEVEKAINDFDNVVVMKAYQSMDVIEEMLRARDIPVSNVIVLSNLGMPDQCVGPMEAGKEYGYFTTLIIKKKGF